MTPADLKQPLLTRLLRYVQVHTTSDAKSATVPSTPQQWDLLHLLRDELTAMGLADITLDDKGYLFATLPATTDRAVPVLGLLAHVDTAPDFSGENVRPQVVEHYDGGDIRLAGSGAVLSPQDFPQLGELRCSDGCSPVSSGVQALMISASNASKGSPLWSERKASI